MHALGALDALDALDPCHALIPPQAKATRAMAQPACDDQNNHSTAAVYPPPPQVTGQYYQAVMYGTSWAVTVPGNPASNRTMVTKLPSSSP